MLAAQGRELVSILRDAFIADGASLLGELDEMPSLFHIRPIVRADKNPIR